MQTQFEACSSYNLLHDVAERSSFTSGQTESNTFALRRRWRRFFPFSKVTLIILTWNFLQAVVFATILQLALMELDLSNLALLLVGGGYEIMWFLCPVCGFIADVYLGQYRVILFGLSSVWIALIIAFISSLLFFATGQIHQLLIAYSIPVSIASLLLIVGMASFISNIGQFGFDQLLELPNDKVSAFFHWLIWTLFASNVFAQVGIPILRVLVLSASDTTAARIGVSSAAIGTLCVLFGVLLFLNCCVHHWFNINPRRYNPYKLVLKVLYFAHKYKAPIQRSALTYCENVPPSRLDLGKDKYGGPFTTEQVEDVKTFLQLLGLVFCVAPNFTHQAVLTYFSPATITFNDSNNSGSQDLIINSLVAPGTSTSIVAMTVLPFLIIVIYPYFQRRFPSISTLKLLGFSMILFLIALLIRFLLEIIYLKHFYVLESSCYGPVYGTNCRTSWLAIISHVISGIAAAIFVPSLYTFIFAQSPQHMRGLMIGVMFTASGIFFLVGVIFALPLFLTGSSNLAWVMFLITLVFGVGQLILYSKVSKKYKYRERDEPSNERQYAEAYYGISME